MATTKPTKYMIEPEPYDTFPVKLPDEAIVITTSNPTPLWDAKWTETDFHLIASNGHQIPLNEVVEIRRCRVIARYAFSNALMATNDIKDPEVKGEIEDAMFTNFKFRYWLKLYTDKAKK